MIRMAQIVARVLFVTLCVTLFLPDILLGALVFGIGLAPITKGARRS